MKKFIHLMFLNVLLIVFLFSGCVTIDKSDGTIRYPAGLLSEHPKSFSGYYVKVVGKLTFKRTQDLFPPFSEEDALVCDTSGCIYVHDDTEDLKKFKGKLVKVIGYMRATMFNFPYIEVIKIEELKK